MSKPAVFLDRDGTIIEDKDYLHKPGEVVVINGAADALKRLAIAGYDLFIVTNQSGVGRGYFALEDVHAVHAHLLSLLEKDAVTFKKIYVAPEAPGVASHGRKPSPQFLFDARDEFDLDLAASFMIGDKLSDLQCGWEAGVKHCILVRTGYGKSLEKTDPQKLARATIVDDLLAAADWILSRNNPTSQTP